MRLLTPRAEASGGAPSPPSAAKCSQLSYLRCCSDRAGSSIGTQGREVLGGGQADLVADRLVASDGLEEFGGGARVVPGQLLGYLNAVVIGVVVHGSAGFLCETVAYADSADCLYSTSLRTLWT